MKNNNSLSILAVNSSKWFWFKSLVKGSFAEYPAIRLHGEAGALREATEIEINLWHKRVKSVSFTKGHKIMFRDMCMVRDIKLSKIDPVNIGSMTANINFN